MAILRKNNLTVRAILLVAILVFVGAYFATHQKTLCAGTPKESLDCFVRYYTAMTETRGASFALSDLENRADTIGVACHQVAHAIGRTAVAGSVTLGEAFSGGSSVCLSGFYHGAMEGIISKYGETYLAVGSIDNICRDFRGLEGETFDMINCTHGMGHGILNVTHGDLFRSLDICGRLSVPGERERCYGGVFMENLVTDGKNHISKYLRDGDIFYPCTTVRQEYKNACYFYQPIHLLETLNFRDAFASCYRIESDEYKTACYRGIGKQTNGSNSSLARRNLPLCLKGETKEMQSACVSGAADSYFHFYNTDRTDIYCANLPQELRDICRDAKMQPHG